MAPRYKIVIRAAKPGADYTQAAGKLSHLMGADLKESREALNYLPFTVTQQASESNAVKLIDTFSQFGFQIDSNPLVPIEEVRLPRETAMQERLNKFSNVSVVSAGTRAFSKSFIWLSVIFFIITLIFGVTLFVAFKAINNHIHPKLQQVDNLMEQGKFSTARDILTREIDKGNATSQSYLQRAISQIARIRRQGYRSNWSKHLTSRYWGEDLNKLANYYRSDVGDKALSDLHKALTLSPNSADVNKWLGLLHKERREYLEADIYMQRALKLEPGNIETLNYAAIIKNETGQYAQAESLLMRALKVEPGHALTLKNMGALQLYQAGDTARALRYYLKYMKTKTVMDFDRPVIREEVTRLLWNKYYSYQLNPRFNPAFDFSMFESSRLKLIDQLNKTQSASLYLKLGELYEKRGMYEEAFIQWDKGIRLSPEMSQIYQKMFMVQGALGRYASARGTMLKAVKNKAATAEMYMALGILYKYFEEMPDRSKRFLNQYLKFPNAKRPEIARLELGELQGL